MKKWVSYNWSDEGYLKLLVGYNRPINIQWATPEWRRKYPDEIWPYFRYQNNRYYLSESECNNQVLTKINAVTGVAYVGYYNYTYSSGILWRYTDKFYEAVYVVPFFFSPLKD